MKTSFRIYLKVTLFVLLAVAVVLGAVGAWLYHDHKSKSWATVHYLTPDGESIERVRLGEEHTLLVPEEIEGYTFLRWRDEQGNTEKRDSITVHEDVWYAADYAIALETKEHPVYLFPDENGYYRPQDPMLRSDAVTMLHILLGKPSGSGSFLDVAKKAPYAKAAAALRELGVISGSRLHPDEAITRGELLEMLATLYPAAKEGYVFADLEPGQPFYDACCTAAEQGWIESGKKVKANADEILTRAETAGIINRITGRAERPGARILQVGCPVDLYPSEEGYWDMIEACIPHEYEKHEDRELWTDSTPAEKLQEGRRMIGWRLSWIGADGRVLRDTEVGNLYFDRNGWYTSGSPELDALVAETLDKVLVEGMDEEEELLTLYRYVRDNFKYVRREPYEAGETPWLVDEATDMLATGKGNCYSYASAYCMLVRAIGVDAIVISGHVGSNVMPHGWVEIVRNGEPHIFDTELSMAHPGQGDLYYYDRSYEEIANWAYVKG
ncbi:MAG: transglutaminase domain-containing protein [Oscillospiraceae bacterium]|nr:transglutaminase domain-containing protein [Oscillospiraceae bacterium]